VKYLNNQFKKLSVHYDSLFCKYKFSFKTAQQSSKETHYKRFKILTEGINFINKDKVLDYGCGTAELLNFLKKKKNFKGMYTGIDIAPNIISSLKKKYYYDKKVNFFNIDILKNSKNIRKFDYIFISGTYNNLIKDNWDWMKKTLKILFRKTNKILVFNNLTTYVDYKDKYLFYIEPEKIFKFCKTNLSQKIILRHDYTLKKKILPYEYTTSVIK
jgi:SAM-dependent methyltransferase